MRHMANIQQSKAANKVQPKEEEAEEEEEGGGGEDETDYQTESLL